MKRFVDHFEEALGVALLAVMAVLAFVNVLTRYFIHYSFAFTEEIEVALLVWLTMLGTAAGFRRGMHLGFNFLVDRFPAGLRRVLLTVGSAAGVAIFTVLIRFGLGQIQDELQLGVTTEALGTPQWWYTLAIPVGSALIIFRVIETNVRMWRGKGA